MPPAAAAMNNGGVITVTTIKVSYVPEHEVYQHQVTADTAVLQHLRDPTHGWGWVLFVLEPGGHRLGDYFIPGRPDRRGRRRGSGQAPTRRAARRPLNTQAPRRTHAYHRLPTKRHRDEVLVTRRHRIDLALLLIIRRAERAAAVRGPSPGAEPDARTARGPLSASSSAGPSDDRHLHSLPERPTGAR
jgi:hypothetical protein